jgi:hypothetical protein
MISAGRLRLEDRTLSYEAAPWRLPFNRMHNLRFDWRFALTAPDITVIEDFEASSPVARYYNIPFVRVHTRRAGELADLLLCVGGLGPFMGRIRERNAELSAKLTRPSARFRRE